MGDRFEYVPISSCQVVGNVRQRFDEEKLKELAASITEHGIIEPLIVRRDVELPDGTYALVAGERRLRAAKLVGLEEVPVIIRVLTAAQAAKVQLLENLQRQDLDPIEEAEGFKKLLADHGYTQDKLAEELGVSQSHIANRIRLLRLPDRVQDAISRGILFAGHGLALLKLAPEGAAPSPILKEAIDDFLEEPPAVAAAGDRLNGIIRQEGRSLDKAGGSWDLRWRAAFDHKEHCEKTKCPYLVRSKDQGIGPKCINPPCWEQKQAVAKEAFEKAEAEREAKAREKQKAEQKKYAQAEKERQAKEKRRRLEDLVGKAPEPSVEPVVAATKPEELPLTVRYLAEELQQLGQSVWQTFWADEHHQWGGADQPAVISRECFLTLSALLQFFVARQEIGASQMPMQFGDTSELHVPEHQLWIDGADGTGPMAGISFEGNILRFGRGPGYQTMGGGFLLEPRPESPAYYRIEVAGEDANKILRSQVVIQGQGRHLVLTGTGRLGIRKDLVKKLRQLVETLPAMPKLPGMEAAS